MKICGVEIVKIELVSVPSGGSWEDGVFVGHCNNEISVIVDEEISSALLAVQHIQYEDQIVEFKEVGPFVYFAIFRIKELMEGVPQSFSGAYGSKYLGVSRGGWSSNPNFINSLGVYDELVEVNLNRTVTHMTKAAVEYLAAEQDIKIDWDLEGCFKMKAWAEVGQATTRFANHGGI